MNLFSGAPHLTLITGHYGAGKTNLALNIARGLQADYERVTLIDLDIVNPYFRSSDSLSFLQALNIELLGPVYGTNAPNLDTPSLSPGIGEAMQQANKAHAVVVDVGGDPDGARALARYEPNITNRPYRLIYVVNFRRPQATTLEENLELIAAIEQTAKLKTTALIGNTHLKEFTDAEVILASVQPLLKLAQDAQLPLAGITAPKVVAPVVEAALTTEGHSVSIPVYPLDLIVTTPWE
ncbi:MAG: hypothetical protein LBS98_04420 [Coriobacteriales bacterium]|jgi:hypothetical protein|nr:hypothetical protein [Coriobacteriales bacterium]